MDKRSGKLSILGHWIKIRDLSMYTAIVVAVVVTIVAEWNQRLDIAICTLVALVVALTWFSIESNKQMEKKTDNIHTDVGKLELVWDMDDIFYHGVTLLKKARREGCWGKVRIYAPVGLWAESKAKDEWLETLKIALNRGDVKEFWGVFGLPPDKSAFDNYGKPRLKNFKDTPKTEIHYLPPSDKDHPTAAPGFGLVIFEDERNRRYDVAFGFAVPRDDRIAGSGFHFKKSVLGQMMANWYDNQVFFGDSSANIVRGPGRSLDEGLAEIEDLYARCRCLLSALDWMEEILKEKGLTLEELMESGGESWGKLLEKEYGLESEE